MRHGAKINHLGRKTPHRKALMRNLACQLIQHKRIVTTLAKAKALRVFVEPLLTKSKEDTTHQRRVVFSYLQDKEALKELFSTVNTKIANRPGGYCRIIKLEKRVGDAADMAMIELVDFNEIYNAKETVGEEKKKTRRGRPKKVAEAKTEVKTEAPAPVAVEEAAVVEDVVAEMPAVAEEVVVAEMPAVAEDVVAETPAADDTTATETPSEDQKEEPLA
ncbi:MAG: 50S ribosomal protein L17 [Chitinophagaceae bacterium]|jgi:large subunit ribosomal protein L17